MKAYGKMGMKTCINELGHMTKMAAMPIYGKKTLKIFFSRTNGLMALNMGCSIRYSSSTKSVHSMTLG